MKVTLCKGCPHKKRRVWSTYYKPAGYHAIGVSHAYAYCDKYKCRCLEVKKCEEITKGEKYYDKQNEKSRF